MGLDERRFTPAELLRAAQPCRVDSVVRPYLEAMAARRAVAVREGSGYPSVEEGKGSEPGGGYRPFVLEELARWGLVPRAGTDPAAVYSLLKSIYSYEIRRMKGRHREKERVLGPQPLEDYRGGLHELKERYRVLKLAWWQWVE